MRAGERRLPVRDSSTYRTKRTAEGFADLDFLAWFQRRATLTIRLIHPSP